MKAILAFCGEDLAREPLGDLTSKTGTMNRQTNLVNMRHASRIVQACRITWVKSPSRSLALRLQVSANANGKTSWKLSFGTSFSKPEDQGDPRWYGRRFLAKNNPGFTKDGGDERLPRFLSRAVALSKGCTGHGLRLYGQRRVSSYYYWDRLVIFVVGYFFFLLLLVS